MSAHSLSVTRERSRSKSLNGTQPASYDITSDENDDIDDHEACMNAKKIAIHHILQDDESKAPGNPILIMTLAPPAYKVKI